MISKRMVFAPARIQRKILANCLCIGFVPGGILLAIFGPEVQTKSEKKGCWDLSAPGWTKVEYREDGKEVFPPKGFGNKVT